MYLLKNMLYVVIATALISNVQAQNHSVEKIEVLLLGTLHFNQFHNSEDEYRNFLGERRQKEFQEVTALLTEFDPDAVFIERQPSSQMTLDSLYKLPLDNLQRMKDGRSEAYQIGFRLAKKVGITRVYGVDYYESIPQNLLEAGQNMERFNQALGEFRNVGRGITQRFLKGELSIKQFLIALNKPENIAMSHQLFYSTPAYVQNGSFKNNEGLNNEIDTTQIGAEFISLFYERNLKIYSNILNQQLKTDAKRIVIIVGQVHVGVLKDIIKNNPNYEVLDVNNYLAN